MYSLEVTVEGEKECLEEEEENCEFDEGVDFQGQNGEFLETGPKISLNALSWVNSYQTMRM